MRSRVFALVPTSKLDVSTAHAFGDLRYLYTATNPLPPVLSPTFGLDTLTALEDNDYDPDRDYILLAGPYAAMFQWIAAIISEHEWCQSLIFDSTKNAYVERTLGLPEQDSNGHRRRNSVQV